MKAEKHLKETQFGWDFTGENLQYIDYIGKGYVSIEDSYEAISISKKETKKRVLDGLIKKGFFKRGKITYVLRAKKSK